MLRKLTPELAEELKKPMGKLFAEPVNVADVQKEIEDAQYIVVVGDMTALWFIKNKLRFNVAIVDGKTQRKPISAEDIKALYHCGKIVNILNPINPPSTVSNDLSHDVKYLADVLTKNPLARQEKWLVWVDGEEDLAVIPVALFFPKSTAIVYGQPTAFGASAGVVVCRNLVDDVLKIVNRMTVEKEDGD